MSSEHHKLKGNEHFKKKEYDEAIQEYTTAIVKNPGVAAYYSNRANCYLKLEKYIKVIPDCERVVELDPKSVKGYYFMGKAQLEIGQPGEAYSQLKKSYDLALEQRSAFIKEIIMVISEAKKQKWIEDERRRLAQVSETYRYLSSLINQDIQRQLDELDKNDSGYQDDVIYLRSERDQRLKELESMVHRAGVPDTHAKPYLEKQNSAPLISPASSPQMPKVEDKSKVIDSSSFQIREVPDYFLDKITFDFMHDPVISTKSGVTYERNTLIEHFSYGRMFDPVSQAPMTEADIIPNRALKEACDEFISKNGWAVDF